MPVSYSVAISRDGRCSQVEHAARTICSRVPERLRVSSKKLCALISSSDSRLDIEYLCAKMDSEFGRAGCEGYTATSRDGDVALMANSQYGLASGLHAVRRAIVSGTNIMEGNSTPDFSFRDVYHFLTPWRLRGLSADSMWYKEWVEHIDNIRRLGANRLYIDFWADQYYHPDHPETCGNLPLWELLRKVFDYAHSVGLRTGVVLFPHQVPPWLYDRNPEARAVEAANYHGIHLCWSRTQEKIVPFDRFVFEFFGSSLDDAIVEFQDPGLCFCKECCDQLPEIVLQSMDLYRSWMGNSSDRRLDLCTLHFRDWIEDPQGDSRVDHPVTGLRKKVFSALAKETVIFDIDGDTMEMARGYGLRTNHFFFDLDPESGIPDETVFPRPKLARIPEQISLSLANKTQGMLDYRLMPRTQFVADELLLRKCWDYSLTVDEVLSDLAAELGLAKAHHAQFVHAIQSLEEYWAEGLPSSIAESSQLFAELPKSHEKITRLADLTAVLAILAPHIASDPQRVQSDTFYPDAALVEQVYQRMRTSPIFSALTIDMHWEIRARETVGQHIRWWMRAIARGFQRQNTGTAAW